jgi:hypothetical protein
MSAKQPSSRTTLLPLHLDCDSFLLTFLVRKGVKDLAALCCEGVGIEKETESLTPGSCRTRDRVTIDE